jgi:hypothetical protein
VTRICPPGQHDIARRDPVEALKRIGASGIQGKDLVEVVVGSVIDRCKQSEFPQGLLPLCEQRGDFFFP